jgi:hypothetical protein
MERREPHAAHEATGAAVLPRSPATTFLALLAFGLGLSVAVGLCSWLAS